MALVKFFIILLLLLIAPSLALSIELDPNFNKQAHQIFYQTLSPFCPGRLLSDCPSTAATELKDKIRIKLNAGESRADRHIFSRAIRRSN